MTITNTEIEDLGKSPRKVTTDEGEVVERSVKELIEAEKHVAAKNSPDSPLFGLRISRAKPGGAV